MRYFAVPIAVKGTGTSTAARPLTLPAEVAAPSMTVDVGTSYSGQISRDSGVFTTTQGFLSANLAGQGNATLYTRPGVWIPAVSPAPWVSVEVTAVQASNDDVARSVGTHPDGTQVRVLATVQMTPPSAKPSPTSSTPPSASSSSASSSTSAPTSSAASDAPPWPGGPSPSDTSAASTADPSPSGSSTPSAGTAGEAVTGQYELVLTLRAGRWEVSALDPAPVLNTPSNPTK